MSIRILLADDHELLRMGLATLLGCEKDMEVVGEASDGNEAVTLTKQRQPDVIIMDLMMPSIDGVEATRLVCKQRPDVKVLILTSFGTSTDIARAIQAGASGVLVKDAPSEELPAAIRRIVAGEKVFSHEAVNATAAESSPPLSPRQQQILASLMRGLSNTDIAQLYGISPTRVKQHTSAIFRKLGAANRAEAVAIALRNQLLKA